MNKKNVLQIKFILFCLENRSHYDEDFLLNEKENVLLYNHLLCYLLKYDNDDDTNKKHDHDLFLLHQKKQNALLSQDAILDSNENLFHFSIQHVAHFENLHPFHCCHNNEDNLFHLDNDPGNDNHL